MHGAAAQGDAQIPVRAQQLVGSWGSQTEAAAISPGKGSDPIEDRSGQGVDRMRLLIVGLGALMLVSACAALQRTESLPSPAADAIQGGPEGESDYSYSAY